MKSQIIKNNSDGEGNYRRYAFAGMVVVLMLVSGCESTYKKETLKQSVQELAKKEYKLDVDVAQEGKTLGVRFKIPNLLSELYSGDEDIYKKMNGLFTILARVGLSSDVSPDFIVLDIVDEGNPNFRLVFTRYMEDVRKSMAEALSYSQSQDRLIQEFVVNGKRIAYDPSEMDLVRVMMLAVDTEAADKPLGAFILDEVSLNGFLERVTENTMRRLFRERREVKDEIQAREVTVSLGDHFNVLLDLVSRADVRMAPQFVEQSVLPLVAKEVGAILKSYRFDKLSDITIIEKNSGKTLTVPAR